MPQREAAMMVTYANTFVVRLAATVRDCPPPAGHRDCAEDYAALGVSISEGPNGLRIMKASDEHAKAVADLLEIDRDAFAYVRLGRDVADMRAAEHYLLGEKGRGR